MPEKKAKAKVKAKAKPAAKVEKKKAMTKAQIVGHFAEKFQLSKKTSAEFLDELAKLAAAQTKENGEFTIPGVGKLTLAQRKAREGRNPATGAPIQIPAKTVVKMRLSKSCQEAIVPPKK